MTLKKTIAWILTALLCLALCACGAETANPQAVGQTPTPVETPFREAPILEPAPDVINTLGSPVVVSVEAHNESYGAPDESGRTILTFGYDSARVYMESNPTAAEQINEYLARQDELFYSGTDNGDGLNAYLERATDNYAYASESGEAVSVEFSCIRNVIVDRGDDRVLSLRFRTSSYTGGAHGDYLDRSYVFDSASGQLLTLDDLSDDPSSLKAALLQKMNDLLENDVRYQPLVGYMEQFVEADKDELLRGLLRDGSWTLNESGLTVYSDIYEIGSYADGIVRFSMSYDELDGLLRECWKPTERPFSGSIGIADLHSVSDGAMHLLDKVTVAKDGEEFCVYANGTVYDLSIDSVTYISDDVGFYQTETHWYGSYLSDSGIQIQTRIPEGMPELMIRYLDENGNVHFMLITENGSDGSVMLLEKENVTAVG